MGEITLAGHTLSLSHEYPDALRRRGGRGWRFLVRQDG